MQKFLSHHLALENSQPVPQTLLECLLGFSLQSGGSRFVSRLPPLDRFLPRPFPRLVGNPLTDGVGDTIPTRVPCVLARCVFTSIFVPCPVKADVDAIEGLHITTIFSLWLVLSLPRILLVNTLACTWCWSWWWEDCRHSLCSINLIEQRRVLKFFSQKPMCVAEILMTLFHGCLGLKLDSSGWAAKNASCLRSS